MEYRKLGQSGPDVSVLCLGAMNFGSQTNSTTAEKIVEKARDVGVNFIDTADVYADGLSEEVVGVAIGSDRENWIVASKVGFRSPTTSSDVKLNNTYIRKNLEGTLQRLDTDFLDLYYLHADDPNTPLTETLATVAELMDENLIKGFGLSNYPAWRIAEVCGLCDSHSMAKPIAYQPCYNLLTRNIEIEVIAACAHFGIGIVPYSPLARGVLTGKYQTGENIPEDSRAARAEKRFMETEYRPESLRIAKIIEQYAELRETTSINFVVNWVLKNSQVVSAIAGPRTYAHWEACLDFSEFSLTVDDEQFVDALVAPSHSTYFLNIDMF